MGLISVKDKAIGFLSKYRFVLLVLLAGLILMLIPSNHETETAHAQPQATVDTIDISAQLEQILCQIEGVGRVEVMVTIASGEKTIYQYDQDYSGSESGSNRLDTVIVSDAQRSETGLVQQINPPVYQGAIVICQGAENASVRLNVIEAVSKVTGLGTDRISVLKMK